MTDSERGARTLRPGDVAVVVGLLVAAVALSGHIGDQVDRLLFQENQHAGVDLRMRIGEAERWWQGSPIYSTEANAVYPPWAYLILRALVVVPTMAVARVAWAVETLVLMVAASWAFVRWGGARTLGVAVLAGAIPLLVAATWHGAGNGQLHLLSPGCACAAVALALRPRPSWGSDLVAALLFAVAMVKPTCAAPFFVVLLAAPGRLRPAALAVGVLGVLTLVAAIPQDAGVFELMMQWTTNAVAASEHGSRYGATNNLSTSLWRFEAVRFGGIGALALWGALGLWVGARAKADVVALLGVAAIVTRISVYHRVYDDVLLLPALLALLRMAWGDRTSAGWTWAARGLLVSCIPPFVVPYGRLDLTPYGDLVTAWSGWSWLVIGALLIAWVERERRSRE